MRKTRVLGYAMVLALGACGGQTGGGGVGGDDDDDGIDPPMPEAWQIDVDMSATDRYVVGGPAMWKVSGRAEASLGLAGVEVAGAAMSVAEDGSFSTDVAVVRGMTVVPVIATDAKGNTRQAHRALISADYLPEGAMAPGAAALVLNDAILAAMAGPLAMDAGDIDVVGEILARPTLSVDDRCTTWPVSGQQGEVEVELELDGEDLWLNVRVPGLYVYFEGACDGLFSSIPIAGEMYMDIDVWTRLTPNAGTPCIVGFQNTTPEVSLPGFSFDVWGMGGPLQGWLVELGSSGKAQEAHDTFVNEFTAQADGLLGDKLAGIKVFDRQETMSLLGQSVDLKLCLVALVPSAGQLLARVGATAQGVGERSAPGAPQMGGTAAAPGANELLLDADLVGQLLFSAWRGGGLEEPAAQQLDFGLLAALAPDLAGRHPDGTMVDVNIDGQLPPVVTASPVEGADLRVEIGDLMLDLAVGDDHLFLLSAHLVLDLDLVPDNGGLIPTLVSSTAEVHLLGEAADISDPALESAVQAKVGAAAGDLLGGAKLKLPDIPGLGTPTDVKPDTGGRYLRVHTE